MALPPCSRCRETPTAERLATCPHRFACEGANAGVSIEVAATIDDAPAILERRWVLFTVAERLAVLEGITADRGPHDEWLELERQIRATLCERCGGNGEVMIGRVAPAPATCGDCGGTGNRPTNG